MAPLIVARVKPLIGPKLAAVERSLVDCLDGCPEPLREPAISVFRSGGKRLRPLLHLLAADLCGYSGDQDVLHATALEYVHVASLLHDDVIDEAVLRRGMPTTNEQYGKTLTVLVGDYLCMKAMALAIGATAEQRPGAAPGASEELLSLLSRTTLDLVEGEALQEASSGELDISVDDYLHVVELKTGRLMAAATEGAAALVGDRADDPRRAGLREYGLQLGRVFQLADDILDFSSDEETLGKPVLSDLKEGTVTLPVIHALAEGGETARRLVSRVVEDGGFDRTSREEILALVRDTGGLDAAERRANEAAAAARAALDGLPDGPSLEALRFATDYAITREF